MNIGDNPTVNLIIGLITSRRYEDAIDQSHKAYNMSLDPTYLMLMAAACYGKKFNERIRPYPNHYLCNYSIDLLSNLWAFVESTENVKYAEVKKHLEMLESMPNIDERQFTRTILSLVTSVDELIDLRSKVSNDEYVHPELVPYYKDSYTILMSYLDDTYLSEAQSIRERRKKEKEEIENKNIAKYGNSIPITIKNESQPKFMDKVPTLTIKIDQGESIILGPNEIYYGYVEKPERYTISHKSKKEWHYNMVQIDQPMDISISYTSSNRKDVQINTVAMSQDNMDKVFSECKIILKYSKYYKK